LVDVGEKEEEARTAKNEAAAKKSLFFASGLLWG
jgi:hypothetical protein